MHEYVYDVVVKKFYVSLSHLLMSFLYYLRTLPTLKQNTLEYVRILQKTEAYDVRSIFE